MRFGRWLVTSAAWVSTPPPSSSSRRYISRGVNVVMESSSRSNATNSAAARGGGRRSGGRGGGGAGRNAPGRSSSHGDGPSAGRRGRYDDRGGGYGGGRGGRAGNTNSERAPAAAGGRSGSGGRAGSGGGGSANTASSFGRSGGRGGGRGGRGRSGFVASAAAAAESKLKNGEKGAEAHTVNEEYRIRLTRALMDLREDDSKTRIEFPSTLTNTERKFVHELSGKLGLKSKSHGKGDDRNISVTKPKQITRTTVTDDAIPVLSVGPRGLAALKHHMETFPPTHAEELDSHETGASMMEALQQQDGDDDDDNDAGIAARLDQLGLGVHNHDAPEARRRERHVDVKRRVAQHARAQQVKQTNRDYAKMLQGRSKLPAYQHIEEIVRTVAINPVTIVSGETGCGKSTQVPQFLLDANPACSIVVTQPRRISAISIAERVVEEQCQDSVGGLIGYQVRLDSAVSADTQLAFMTPGILLRKMQSSPQLSEYTHIIIDEIHERDKYQEFLLIVLRDLLPVRPDLRIVLMSATLQTVALVEYFETYGLQPAVVKMEGRMFPVQEFFLEQVLEMTGYVDATTGYDGGAKMEEELAKLTGQTQQQQQLQRTDVTFRCAMCGKQGFADALELGEHIALCDGFLDSDDDDKLPPYSNGATKNTVAGNNSFDKGRDASLRGDHDVDDYEDYDVDGKIELQDFDVDALSAKQASSLAARTATSTASAGLRNITTQAHGASKTSAVLKWDGESSFGVSAGAVLTPTEQALLDKYQAMHDDETVDSFLVLEVVRYIVKSSYGDGGILIFFPGWQEITEFTRMLESTAPFYDRSKFLILPLHSGIPSREQRRVLQRPPKGVRKIVLSTNIAETSLTIEDCVFVVDTGRSKEKNYDPHLKTSTLQPTWVSQASAKQRKGRAGRVKAGVCFHLFSSTRHQSLRPFTESELLRTPLEEMCLMCKQLGLAPGGPEDDDGVPAFLAKALSVPHLKSVSNALELLVDLGAMQPETNKLTTLGECLAVLSLEPRVGKMVIWSYLLGCVRVASNMAVAMSYKSPFVLPRDSERRAAEAAKVEISQNSESDQITVHNALDMRQQYRNDGAYNDFCRRNFLGVSTMQMISDLRQNLTRELSSLGFPNPSIRDQFHNRHDNEDALWHAAIAAGLYPNIASRKQGEVNFTTMTGQKVKVHVSSVNAARGQPLSAKCQIPEGEVEFLCFGEMVKGLKMFNANQTTRLPSPLPLLLLCGTSLTVRPHPDNHAEAILSLDDWIVFKCDAETAARIVVLRKRLESAFWNTVSNPSRPMLTDAEQDAVEIMGTVLQSAHIVSQCPI